VKLAGKISPLPCLFCKGKTMEIRIIIDGESVSVNADQSKATAHRPEIQLREDMNVRQHMDDVARAYLKHAKKVHGPNYTKIAKMLKLTNYMMAKNWMRKLGIYND
jgi:transcriptional regulator with PAS, ATPase and Fis domain